MQNISRRISAYFLFAGWFVMLGGCVSILKLPVDPERVESHAKRISETQQWSLFGRISLSSDEESWHAKIDWRQDNNQFRIRLIGPFGQGTVQVSGQPGQVTLIDSRNKRYFATDPENLIADTTGWQIPVIGLRQWVRGAIKQHSPAQAEHDSAGHLTKLMQDGWTIHYSDYREVSGIDLPGRLDMQRNAVSVTLVVSRWKL